MSKKILSLTAIMALAFTGLSASCYKDCGKDWKQHKPSKKPIGTVDDLKKQAQSYEAAYKNFMETEAGKASLENRAKFKECIASSSLSNKEIYKAVKNSLPMKRKAAKGVQKHALKDVMHFVERMCKKREPVADGQNDGACVAQTATAYYESLVKVAKECPEAYAKLKIARFAFATVLKSLLKQGMKSEDLVRELQAAGISNEYILGKPAKMAE